MCHGTLQLVQAVKALVIDSPMPHSFLHPIVCDVVPKSKRLTKAELLWYTYEQKRFPWIDYVGCT